MAYNTFFPATYQPYPMYYQQQNVQQNVQPSSLIWVGSFSEAQMYPVAPNAAVALWDSSSPAIYLKQADASGKPTLKIYDLKERTEAPQGAAVSNDYAKKSDLDAFGKALEEMRSDIETMRGDVYGLAGKKRTVKKEVAEDE